jgi:chitodextrinase
MIFTKTHFSLTFVLVFLFTGLLVAPVSAADYYISDSATNDYSSVYVVTSSDYVEPGEPFTIDIVLAPSQSVSGVQFDLLFSGTDYTIDSIEEGDFFSRYAIPTTFGKKSNDNSMTMYLAALGPYSVSMPGKLITVQVTAGDSINHLNINLSNVVVSNSLSQKVPFHVGNTSVTVDSDYVLEFGTSDYLSDNEPVYYSISSSESVPFASILDIRSGKVGQSIRFDGSGSYDDDGKIISYEWDFGDGSMGDSVSSYHTYTDAGEYAVTLTVIDDGGNVDTDRTTIRIRNTIWSFIRLDY